ncbi:ATP-binding protein [Blastococcus sp. SYSU DS1021]
MALYGREQELAVVHHLLRSAGEGRGGALVVSGAAGIGKSALVAEAVGAAGGVRVLRATGTQFEADLPFAGLHELCSPLLEHLGELPTLQADALRSALGLAGQPTAPEAALLIGAGLLALLGAAARRQPVVCVVDDLQWLDPASTKALAFTARRLDGLAVALLLVVRDGAGGPGTPSALDRLPSLDLAGLPEREARALLAAEMRAPLDPRVRDRVIAEARGNPLALVELPRTFGPAELAGGYALPGDESVSSVLEDSFQHRLALLPAPSRTFTTLAAAEPTGDPALLWRAAEICGLGPEAGLPVEATGLLSLGTRVRFRHPLVRSAVYHAAGLGQRRAAHRALAQATDAVTDPDRRAWHLALAADGPDEAVAVELERSADRAQARGGLAATGAFLERAAVLTPDPARRSDRLLAAADAKRAAGAPEAALGLLAVAEGGALDGRQRALVEVLRARAAFDQRRDSGAVRMLLEAGRSATAVGPVAAKEVLFEAFAAAVFAGRFADPDLMRGLAAAERALPASPGPRRPGEDLFAGLLTQVTRGRAAAAPLLRSGVDACRTAADELFHSGCLWMACSAAQELWDEESFRAIAEQQLQRVRRSGAVASLPVALNYRALVHVHEGDLCGAQVLVDEAMRVAAELEAPPLQSVAVTIAAWRGDELRTAELVRAGTADALARQEGRMLTAMEYAPAVLLNAQGRYAEAREACRRAVELDEQSFGVWIGPEFIEAAVRSGRPEEAVPVHERLSAAADAAGSDWGLGMAARNAALLSGGPPAEEHYLEALERLRRTGTASQRARTHLLYGEWLRREGRAREARGQLQVALDGFSSMGAAAFAARATRELAAAGGRARIRAAAGPAGLTPQELHVARLVAGGATSKEVAAELFLSPRTVDAHLRGIFAKLGIVSRRQLRGLPGLLDAHGSVEELV